MNSRNNKFTSQKRYYNGITFDSGAEVIAYQRLASMPDRVQNLKYHPDPIILKQNNVVVTTYKPDFAYFDTILNTDIICEFKGLSYWNNHDFKIKMKMLGAQGIEVDIFIIQSAQAKFWCTSTMLSDGYTKVPINLHIPRQNIFGCQMFVAPHGFYRNK